MKTSTVIALTAFLLLLLAVPAAFFAGRWTAPKPAVPAPQIDTVWVTDTAKVTDSKPAGSVIATLPVVRPLVQKEPKIEQNPAQFAQELPNSAQVGLAAVQDVPDSALSKTEGLDSIPVPKYPPDSVTVEIPIEQRTYEGEHYRAVVQGYRPELVSIDIRLPQCPTSTSSDSKARFCWTITIGPQWGYGITPQGWQPYAGVGGSIGLSFCF